MRVSENIHPYDRATAAAIADGDGRLANDGRDRRRAGAGGVGSQDGARPVAHGAGIRDVLLVTLTLASGFVEAISYVGLGHVFSVAQTGNMAMLGVRLSGDPGPNLPRTVAALLGFGAGALAGGLIVRRFQGRTADARVVWSRGVTLAVAAGLVLQALFLGLWLGVGGHPSGEGADVLIAISAGAMGAETTAVGSLGVRAVFTTAITATWGMLMGDLSGWAQSRGERRRLAAVLVALIVGALFGGLLMHAVRDWAPVFPLAVSALVVTAAALIFHGVRVPAGTASRADAGPGSRAGAARVSSP